VKDRPAFLFAGPSSFVTDPAWPAKGRPLVFVKKSIVRIRGPNSVLRAFPEDLAKGRSRPLLFGSKRPRVSATHAPFCGRFPRTSQRAGRGPYCSEANACAYPRPMLRFAGVSRTRWID